jgi:hypothetical protein
MKYLIIAAGLVALALSVAHIGITATEPADNFSIACPDDNKVIKSLGYECRH